MSMKLLNALLLSGALGLTGVCHSVNAAVAEAPAQAAVESAVKAEKSAVKQLRGKLLYRRNQIRKLERAAVSGDAALNEKVSALEENRRTALAEAEPKLKELYALEKELQGQIDAMSARK